MCNKIITLIMVLLFSCYSDLTVETWLPRLEPEGTRADLGLVCYDLKKKLLTKCKN